MAHAILEQSQPPRAAACRPARWTCRSRYNSRIDRARSRLTLTSPDHSQTVLTIRPTGPPDLLDSQRRSSTTPGAYVVRWQVLAIDGHITRGDVPFTVTGP